MTVASTAGKYPVRSPHRELIPYCVSFTGANGANPTATNTVDEAKLISTLARTSEGLYAMTFKVGWKKVYAHCNVRSVDPTQRACVSSLTEGNSSSSVINVSTFWGGAVDDLNAVRVDVMLWLQR